MGELVDSQFFEIIVYINRNGDSPFYHWLNRNLDKSTRARIRVRIDKLAIGHMGDHKFLGNGLYELRLAFGPGYRIYFSFIGKSIILLLIGGNKSSQSKDINFAIKLLKEFKERKNE